MEDMVARRIPTTDFWRGRRVLLTGHSGFKGSWAALWLHQMGVEVHGFALAPETQPSLWHAVGAGLLASETIADLADRDAVALCVRQADPEIVLHFAAQALVRRSFADPVGTIATNAMGTVHLLDYLRGRDALKAVLVVTTDKVYENADTGRDFVESDPLGGHDPYSASKAAAELLVRSYAKSFFTPASVCVATARAGNVIGGGDWSADRLVPDVWRAAETGVPLKLRYPNSVRPWQHVLEPLAGYFAYVEALCGADPVPPALNFGPAPGTPMTVASVAEAVATGLGLAEPWQRDMGVHPAEMTYLSLNPTAARRALGWTPLLNAAQSVEWTAQWYADHARGGDPKSLCGEQISQYEALLGAARS